MLEIIISLPELSSCLITAALLKTECLISCIVPFPFFPHTLRTELHTTCLGQAQLHEGHEWTCSRSVDIWLFAWTQCLAGKLIFCHSSRFLADCIRFSSRISLSSAAFISPSIPSQAFQDLLQRSSTTAWCCHRRRAGDDVFMMMCSATWCLMSLYTTEASSSWHQRLARCLCLCCTIKLRLVKHLASCCTLTGWTVGALNVEMLIFINWKECRVIQV